MNKKLIKKLIKLLHIHLPFTCAVLTFCFLSVEHNTAKIQSTTKTTAILKDIMLKCHQTFSTQMVLFQKVTILFIGKSRFVLIVLAAVCFGSVAILNKVVLEQQSECLVNYYF